MRETAEIQGFFAQEETAASPQQQRKTRIVPIFGKGPSEPKVQ